MNKNRKQSTMKTKTILKILLYLIIFHFPFSILHSQTPLLYGMTSAGGTHDTGAVISFNPANDSEKVLWNFGASDDGVSPSGNLIFYNTNNLFYGMTYYGGTFGDGTIFSFNSLTNKDSILWNLGSIGDGVSPSGTLLYDSINNLFYGITTAGGNYGGGTIISFNPAINSETVVWSFGKGKDGLNPTQDLTWDANDSLFYGVTYYGGTNKVGIIFSFNPVTNIENVLWNFGTGTDGVNPSGDLIYCASNGLFYAKTERGGTNKSGTIISFNPKMDIENVVWNFTPVSEPYGGFVYNSNDSLFYGMIYNSVAGSIISFNPKDDSVKLLWNFGIKKDDGKYPFGNLIFDANQGLYYGMTYQGGTRDSGIIFSFNPAKDSEKVLWDFGNNKDGALPYGSFIFASAPVGIDKLKGEIRVLKVNPNPNNGVFNIQWIVNSGQWIDNTNTIEIFDVYGKKIYSSLILQPLTTIHLNEPDGIYFYRVLQEDGSVVGSGKVVIDK